MVPQQGKDATSLCKRVGQVCWKSPCEDWEVPKLVVAQPRHKPTACVATSWCAPISPGDLVSGVQGSRGHGGSRCLLGPD